MKLEIFTVKLTRFFILTISANLNFFSTPMTPSAEACLPRVKIIFPAFGQNGNRNGDTENSYDKQAEQRMQWTTNDWIEKHKYPLERHTVTTKDGYQLQLQRLPKPTQRPVILVHGLLASSLGWVLMGPGKSLGTYYVGGKTTGGLVVSFSAFQLYDKHYDVWLANLRGSAYGRHHTRLNLSSSEFWNFSFHEQGLYDLPAIIDHVRSKSPFHQVLLIGHSQAFNAFLAMCSLLPEYNERVIFMQALAPFTKLKGFVKFKAEDAKMAMKFVKKNRKSQKYEIFPPGYLKSKCLKRNSNDRRECLRIFDTFAGIGQHSRTLDPLLFGSLLQGGSLNEITHLYQIWQSGDFISYDYGLIDNLQHYNSVSPNTYDVNSITVPMILHFGETDAIATPDGVHSIYSRLIKSASIYGVYRVAASKFNHMDFFLSNDIKTLVNDKLIEIMENFFAGKLRYVIE